MSRTVNVASRVVAGRYELQEELGSGGMASVYRALELPQGREVALKQMRVQPGSSERSNLVAWFEREFYTLAQLKHPCVITVYDYGLSERGPYYTMELLDGGDLRERAPVPWLEACALFFDVCSSLALLHSRRLVHRDITPRNIRCTREGRAKLIDFGAMAAMGTGGIQVIGTPAFTAPETVHRLALDGRTDLFSLGSTLYSALTGQLAYPGVTFAEVMAAWAHKPVAPSLRVPGIPPALDDLVLSMLSIEPALRPASAFDVMQRLAAIADLRLDEAHAVTAAYLTTSSLIGRESALQAVRTQLDRALKQHGGAALVRGAPGLGRSKLLDTCALDAKTLGFTVLRATASGDLAAFSGARALLEHLLSALPASSVFDANPELFEVIDERPRYAVRALSGDPEQTQHAICRALLDASRIEPLVIAVDDVHRIDQSSAAVLAALIDRSRRAQLFVLLTADAEDEHEESDAGLVMSVLARRCEPIALERLSPVDTRALLSSIFGDVEHLDYLARELHAIALGNPGDTMELAQYLVDRGLISYSAGSWRLPSTLLASDLPASTEDALRAQLSTLSAPARMLAEAQALAYSDAFDQKAYRELRPTADHQETDHALIELLQLGVIAPAGDHFVLANRIWAAALLTQLDEATCRAHHRALAELYTTRSPSARIYHLFAADEDALGLNDFHKRHKGFEKGFDESVLLDADLWKLLASYSRAIAAAQRLGRSLHEQNDLLRWSMALSVAVDANLYKTAGPAWLAQLRRDSGLDLWQESTTADPGQRLTEALMGAQARYLATPEADRVYGVEESLHRIAEYVVFCIAIGVRNIDLPLLASLPPLLEPFTPLSPLLDGIRNNALATMEAMCFSRVDEALTRWRKVIEQLDALPGTAATHLAAIQNAVAYGIGLLESQLGIERALVQAVRLDHDPLQRRSAIQLRKLVALEQGDWVAAERFRRQSELVALQLRSLQMFRSLIPIELSVYAAARDLVGIQHSMKQMEPFAALYPLWKAHWIDASAQFELARGDYTTACARFREGLSLCVVGPESEWLPQVWISLQAGLAETLLAMHKVDEARSCAAQALRICEAHRVGSLAHAIARMLALAEAASGNFTSANERLDRVLEEQTRNGASGVWLGLTYEARARVAIWSGAEDSYKHFADLAAREYRHGANSPLGGRYERLLDEARRRGFQQLAVLRSMSGHSELHSQASSSADSRSLVTRALSGAKDARDRSQRALRLLCEMCDASVGHVFLVDETEARLTASFGNVAPPPELIALVDTYLTEQRDDDDAATAMVEEGQDISEWTSHAAAKAVALDYELMLLAAENAEGDVQIAGVAAIAIDASRARATKPHKLLAALAAQLIENGD
ncbi:MAG TPA: protein kinase [Polyangiales bacterium]|nr:protein kinase [Polyangiales bacterium]